MEESRPRTPTIRDVARHAGVSVATVSRVLNDMPVVRTEMRERVRAAIGDLGYRPSSTARSLSLGRAQTIGVVAPFFTSPSVVERLRGVVERLAEHDYDLMLFDVETLQQRSDAFQDFARRARVDGLLVISLPLVADEIAALRRDNLPVVLIDIEHAGVPHVTIDDVRGGELAAEHLLARGHRRIGFVGDVADSPFGFTSRRGGSGPAGAAGGGWGARARAPVSRRTTASSGSAPTPASRPGRSRSTCSAATTGRPRSSPRPTRRRSACSRAPGRWACACPTTSPSSASTTSTSRTCSGSRPCASRCARAAPTART